MERSDEFGAAEAVDWAEVRRLYEAGEASVSAILARFGITRYQLTGARLVGGWRTRPQVARPGTDQGRGAVHLPTLKRRLLHIADEHFKAREAQAAAGEAVTLTQSEQALLTALAAVWTGGEAMKRDRKDRAAGKGPRRVSDRPAVGGGFATPEEARAADVAFMRAELKRRVAILRRSAGLDGADPPPEGRGG